MIIFVLVFALGIASVTTDNPQIETTKEIYERKLKERR